jgi:hypothetical protein
MWLEPFMNMHCSETTTPQSTTTWRKRRELQLTPLPSNLSSGEKMEEELGVLLLGQYAGKDKGETEIKLQEAVLHTRTWKGHSNFSLESFTPSTETPTYLWKPVLSTSSTNSLTNIQELASYFMPSKTTMQDCRLPLLE